MRSLGGDGRYSTAPNSPSTSTNNISLSVPQLDLRRDSYDQAQKNTDLLWEWHTGPHLQDRPPNITERIKGQSSPPVPKHVTAVGRHASIDGNTPTPILNKVVVSSNNARVQIGFDPPINTTSLSSLPGTNGDVITSPPPPSNRTTTPKLGEGRLPKPKSIEELDKHRQNYAPGLGNPPIVSGGSPDNNTNAFCLDLSSITGHYSNSVIVASDRADHNEDGVGVAEREVRLEEGVAVVINGEPRSSHSSQETKRRSLSFDMKDGVSVSKT